MGDRDDVRRPRRVPGPGLLQRPLCRGVLQKASPELYAEYKSDKTSSFLGFPEGRGLTAGNWADIKKIDADKRTPEQKTVVEADQTGDRHTLIADSVIPATMAVIYLILLDLLQVDRRLPPGPHRRAANTTTKTPRGPSRGIRTPASVKPARFADGGFRELASRESGPGGTPAAGGFPEERSNHNGRSSPHRPQPQSS